MKYLFDPRLFDGPALFDTGIRLILASTILSQDWAATTLIAAWNATLQPGGWKAAPREET